MTIDERDAVAAGADAWLGTLSDWIAIPSVSADPGHAGDVAASAQYLADALRQTGFPTVEVLAGGPYLPAVFAHWPSGDPDAVRVVVYGHHDVQPAAFEDGWTYPPFEPHLVDGLLHGRGASDDKGNVAIHLLGLQAHLRATGRSSPAVDLTLVVEGEEESGSPHISALLADLAGRLPADVVVISDTGIFDARTPSLVTGMRGLVGGELRVQGPDIDLHSGSFGGAVANPITELVRILAAMHDADRRVAIPGFYDGVDEPTPEERALIDALPFDEQAWVTGPAASKEPTGRGATPPWNGSGCGRRPRSTASTAATPGRAARPSCRPTRTPSCPSAWSAGRIRRRCGARWTPSSRPRPGRRSARACTGKVPACARWWCRPTTRPPWRPGEPWARRSAPTRC
jgi:acetylornithine deacetylase/succinyl-diaminopimelate desuccinylase-like protein